jgi:methionyl aminopeptidase
MIELKSPADLEKMLRANQVVAETLSELRTMIRPGVSTMELEERARELLQKTRARSAFKGYRGFPCCLCASLNDEVVHGIPSRNRVLKEGDLLSLDFGVELEGWYGDAAISLGVGRVSAEVEKLLRVTAAALTRAIAAMQLDNRLSDIARAVEGHVEQNGFSVVQQFVGHGIGRAMHEEPQVPNFGKPRPDYRLREGMVLALEPMVNAGGPEVQIDADGWTARTADGSLSAHFEHSVAVTKRGPEVLSRFGV